MEPTVNQRRQIALLDRILSLPSGREPETAAEADQRIVCLCRVYLSRHGYGGGAPPSEQEIAHANAQREHNDAS